MTGVQTCALPIFFADPDVLEWIGARFPDGTIAHDFATLPINILQFDLFRLLILFARGGVYTDADTYAMKAVEHWGTGAVDLTDKHLLVADGGEQLDVLRSPPALVVGIEWSGRTETNLLNPLFSRSVGVVQWTFGATKGHPVILDAIRRVVRHSHQAMGTPDPSGPATGPLHFDPDNDRMVLEWSGPAVLSDALARCARVFFCGLWRVAPALTPLVLQVHSHALGSEPRVPRAVRPPDPSRRRPPTPDRSA